MTANQTKTSAKIKILVTVTFLAMVLINALANILPINKKTTGQVSEGYPNLFTPAGFTFAIWGLIYLLLALYTLYQLGFFQRNDKTGKTALLQQVGFLFSISSIANGAWIFSWHYQVIPVSMLLMLVILICLIKINQKINKKQLTEREKFFVRLPFRVYYGWITVATIANAVVLLVSLGFDGFGLSQSAGTIIMVLAGAMIGISVMQRCRSISYGLVLIWAYTGILLKHISRDGFGGQYPSVIACVIFCLILFFISTVNLLVSRKKRKNSWAGQLRE